MFMWMWPLLLNLAVLVPSSVSHSAESSLSGDHAAPSPTTNITAKTMTVNNQENQAIFDGSVVLTQGELVVYSDHMVVSFRPSRNGNGSSKSGTMQSGRTAKPMDKKQKPGKEAMPTVSDRAISKIEATGRVKIEKQDGRATCQRAVYYEDDKKIVLTGEPVAWQKGTRVTGKQITMFLEEDRSLVEGGSHVTIEGEGGIGR
jgi:lipopolysaccharide export system protein LptA